MVSEPVDKCETINKKMSWGMFALVFVTVFAVTCLILLLIFRLLYVSEIDNPEIVGECPSLSGEVINSNECLTDFSLIRKIDFQSVIDDWASSVGGNAGVIVYDLMAGEVAGEYNADKKFATASIYKLFVVYAGYLKVDSGEWNGSMMAGSTGHTILQCLDLAIRESNSACAETLWGMIGRDELDEIVHTVFNLPDVYVGSLSATPREIMRMMLRFYQHTEMDDWSLISLMKDSFLNQPKTIYNWRQGLPSGFSNNALVYNKVGWEFDGEKWIIYNDAAIVDFVDAGRTFVVVVMTNNIDYKRIVGFAKQLEESFYNSI